MSFRICHDSTFNLDRHLLVFMQRNPFLAGISRQVRKLPTTSIKTAAVTYDPIRGELVMWYNPVYMASLTDAKVNGTLRHEFYHIVFRHLTARRRDPNSRWNAATDMSINHLIWEEAFAEAGLQQSSGHTLDAALHPLSAFTLRPGHFSWVFNSKTYEERPIHHEEHAATAVYLPRAAPATDPWEYVPGTFTNRAPTKQELRAYQYARAIKEAPGNMSSEWYFEYLNEKLGPDEKDDGEGSGTPDCNADDSGGAGSGEVQPGSVGGSLDDHAPWDDIPDDLREKVENQIKSIIEAAVRQADQQSNGWGHMPADICAMIRKSVSTSIDWKAVVQYFIGTVAKGSSRRTITSRDRKYGIYQPGIVTGHVAHLVIAIDESGSVNDGMLGAFFAELETCTRKISVTILPFDSECRIEDAWEWRKGARPELKRVKSGGTNFDAPTDVINANAHLRGWEGVLVMTDGECCKPGPSNIKRAWVLGAGCKAPSWVDDETVIIMEDGLPATGAWH